MTLTRPSAPRAGEPWPPRGDLPALAREGNVIPIYREILADLETPVSAFLKIHRGPYGFLLESVEGVEKWGRYSFLGTEPARVLRVHGDEVALTAADGTAVTQKTHDPLGALKTLLAGYRPVAVPNAPRFTGGAVGHIGYDLVRSFERLPVRAPDDLGLPEACLLLVESLLVFDNVAQKIKVVSNLHLDGTVSLEQGYDRAVARIDELVARLRRPLVDLPTVEGVPGTITSTFTQEGYERVVAQAKEYIRAGDIIQVVLAQRFELPLAAAPFNVYRCSRTVNPSPYMFFLALDDYALAGASPEVMVRVEGGEVTLRPIAGTRPRGTTEQDDVGLATELASDPKELAEHVMLLDLGRNDVGRVAAMGSVEVTERFIIERYSHVMHLVSNVRGRLAPGRDCFDAFRAAFPAGTLTGAPKIRAMEIIEELEPVRRGVYGGAVGYFGFSGAMDTAITIRTALFRGGRVYVQSGAGIVADSDPESEHRECVNKSRALILAVRLAEALG
jgi:anthranilate synthase component 1